MEYGLIGEKLGHSFSKTVHSKRCDYEYELLEIAPDSLEDFMLKADFKAINVTIPYKQTVIPYLDEIDTAALKIGAVNTVVNKNGRLFGYNTDYYGLLALIKKAEIEICGKKVLILGNGGTAKTAAAVASDLGAASVLKVSRKGENGTISYSEAENTHNDADVIINTTPCGMYPNIGVSAVDIEQFGHLSGVIDAVYNPLCTELVVKARGMGIKAVGGLYMLVAQAAFAAEKFTDRDFDKAQIDIIYEEILLQKRNIVLIGMPSCGKSTVGKALADSLGRVFFDSDEEIVKTIGMSIPEFFATKGEAEFRKIESEIIAELSKKQGAVIATGGGVVLNNRNVELLKQNGFIVFLNRSLDKLVSTEDRPLSSSRELLEKRYKERFNIYCTSADFIADGDGSVADTANQIKEVF